MPREQALIRVTETSQVGEVRRNAARLSELSALNETDRSKVGIIATELANNLVLHTRGGEVVISLLRSSTRQGMELLAIDTGPGMADVGRCLEDGFSTAGTAGTGFGAIRRLSSEFDVYSARPSGTVIVSRVLAPASNAASSANWGVLCVPAPGETLCGDNWSIVETDGLISILLADGLGHGPLAAEAADEAICAFNENPSRAPAALIEDIHPRLRGTRGAAVAIAQGSMLNRQIKYAGIGNVSGALISGGESRGLFSHNGTVGLQIRKIQEFDYPWAENALLIMYSDGLQTRWDLQNYPGLINRHPAVVAGVLYRDFKRGRDDLTIAVVR